MEHVIIFLVPSDPTAGVLSVCLSLWGFTSVIIDTRYQWACNWVDGIIYIDQSTQRQVGAHITQEIN